MKIIIRSVNADRIQSFIHPPNIRRWLNHVLLGRRRRRRKSGSWIGRRNERRSSCWWFLGRFNSWPTNAYWHVFESDLNNITNWLSYDKGDPRTDRRRGIRGWRGSQINRFQLVPVAMDPFFDLLLSFALSACYHCQLALSLRNWFDGFLVVFQLVRVTILLFVSEFSPLFYFIPLFSACAWWKFEFLRFRLDSCEYLRWKCGQGHLHNNSVHGTMNLHVSS